MATIKPVNSGKIIIGVGSRLDVIGATCDVIGMTDIPGVSQSFELVSAGISVIQGDYIGAGLSIGSMLPIAGKAAEAAKLAHKAQRIADGVSAGQKEAKVLSAAAKKADDVADLAKQTKNMPSATPKTAAPQPSKTQAKSANKQPQKEVQDETRHFDSDEWLGLPERKPVGDSIFANPKTSGGAVHKDVQKTNYTSNSNPALNNKFHSTGKPVRPDFGI